MKLLHNKESIIKIVLYFFPIFVLFMTYFFYKLFMKHTKREFFTNNINNTSLLPSSLSSLSSLPSFPLNNDNNNNTIDIEPLPNTESNITSNQKSKTNQLPKTNLNHSDSDPNSFFNDWSPYAKKWPCTMNVTGTFTECGPNAYNNMNTF